MLGLFKKEEVTVEQIHAEIDAAEQKSINDLNTVLNQLEIPTETQLEKKADLMNQLGFIKSETVLTAQELKKKKEEIIVVSEKHEKILRRIHELKVKYPLEKFIPIDVFESICKKYNLIHAPVSHYVKDVPEKNLIEIRNKKPLIKDDVEYNSVKVIGVHPNNLVFKYLNIKGPIITYSDLECCNYKYKDSILKWYEDGDATGGHAILNEGTSYGKPLFRWQINSDLYRFNSVEVIKKEGLFVAAPKSHFNLKDLKQKSKYGFFQTELVKKQEPKDPIVFEYCRGNIVRIITKWGTADDKSFMDPELNSDVN
ncbi:MAG: hypothetical protein ACK52I_07680 [Pseudomonadota bacterium]|jgi:hypothetical protein